MNGSLLIEGEPLEPLEALEASFYRLYRNFFDLAERKRRWSLREDIPWDLMNPALNPAVATVVESFCAVEMYLPDYVGQAMRGFRTSRAQTWFYANWGYEESKHSLALGDWLLRSGMRSDEQMADLEGEVFSHEWLPPLNSRVGMLAYAMVQELVTALYYRNLRRQLGELGGDPALSRLLGLLSIDEQAHHRFFLAAIKLHLRHDREETLRQLHQVFHTFTMPALHLLADSRHRHAVIESLHLFDHTTYFKEVYQTILAALKVSPAELRRCAA